MASPPPPWVKQLPLVGERVAQMWSEAAAAGSSELISRLLPYADDIASTKPGEGDDDAWAKRAKIVAK